MLTQQMKNTEHIEKHAMQMNAYNVYRFFWTHQNLTSANGDIGKLIFW